MRKTTWTEDGHKQRGVACFRCGRKVGCATLDDVVEYSCWRSCVELNEFVGFKADQHESTELTRIAGQSCLEGTLHTPKDILSIFLKTSVFKCC